MHVHLLDGTYELFRQHFGRKRAGGRDAESPYSATVGVLRSVLTLLTDGATHIGVASDHVIESFRNDLWPGYKTSEGMPPELLAQIPLLEDSLTAMGVTVWAVVEWEADDALASAAAVAVMDERVERVEILTPDKDLGQCVGGKVVQVDRRQQKVLDAEGVREKFGVPPESIPDYLALVGDSADGFPGVSGWGAKSAAAVLSRYGHLEDIPTGPGQWDVPGVRNARGLMASLLAQFDQAMLFRRLATLDLDVPVGTVDDWEWTGPAEPDVFADWCRRLGAPDLPGRVAALVRARHS